MSQLASSENSPAIEVHGLTKKFGSLAAVDDLTFSVTPGRITGFLGPNGAGKTTTLRMLLGLIRSTAGTATIFGQPYHDIHHPMKIVGSALEATNFHPGRTARDHLRVLTAASGIPDKRADELLELVGIPAAANKRAGGFSMGMRQRLGLAAALLGDPKVLILDEPANGLDPEGIRWLRHFLRTLADEGRTILVSSHLLSEVEHTVDDVLIIANGKLVAEGTVDSLRGEPTCFIKTSQPGALVIALQQQGVAIEPSGEGFTVHSHDLAAIGQLAFAAGAPVLELRSEQRGLEQLFFELTETPEHRNRNLDGMGGAA